MDSFSGAFNIINKINEAILIWKNCLNSWTLLNNVEFFKKYYSMAPNWIHLWFKIFKPLLTKWTLLVTMTLEPSND